MPRSHRLWHASLAVVFVLGATGLLDASPPAGQTGASAPAITQEPVDPPAHINFVDGSAVLERDGQPDTAPLNMPLLSGDRIRTENGRVEILFADGSTLHLDLHSSVDFQSDELIRLREGRVRLAIPGPSRTVSYRIDAAAGFAQVGQPGDYRVSLLKGCEEELELAVLRGAADLITEGGRTALRAGERARACANSAPSYAFAFNSASWDAFDRWSETRRDQRFTASAQYLPAEVRPYSASLDQYGSWQYESSYGYVWYPTVAASWRPYYYGRWAPLPAYGWTWIGHDPWAWPTHHYGRWGFSAGLWFWIPGSIWSPAWVSWAYAPGYVSWCPLGYNNRAVFGLNVGYGYGYGHGYGYNSWHGWAVPRQNFGHGFVHAGGPGVAVPRGGFASGTSAPNTRGVAVPRSTVPIRTVGAAVARGSSSVATFRSSPGGTPVYTNLPRTQSRVGTAPSYVGTAPASDGRRAASPDGSIDRAQAAPRSGQPAASGPGASARVSPPAEAAPTAGTISSPRSPGGYGAIERAPARTAVPRADPYAGAYRSPGGIASDRGTPMAPPQGMPERAPIPRADPRPSEAASGPRAIPRGYESAPPPSAYRPPAGVERGAPEASRPSAPPPSAAPRTESHPGAAPPPSGQRSSGGQPSGGARSGGRGGV
jgi:Family of unknown function (DUF6600)/FecR protein